MDNKLQIFYKRLYQLLENIGKSFHLPNDEIQDIIHQLFLEFAEKNINFSLIKNPDGYIVTSFKRKIIDYLRKTKQHHFPIHEMYGDIGKTENFEEVQEKEEERKVQVQALYEHFKHLPKRCKKVLFLKYYYRLDNDEIAERTGLSMQSIYNNLSEGIKLLRGSFTSKKNI